MFMKWFNPEINSSHPFCLQLTWNMYTLSLLELQLQTVASIILWHLFFFFNTIVDSHVSTLAIWKCNIDVFDDEMCNATEWWPDVFLFFFNLLKKRKKYYIYIPWSLNNFKYFHGLERRATNLISRDPASTLYVMRTCWSGRVRAEQLEDDISSGCRTFSSYVRAGTSSEEEEGDPVCCFRQFIYSTI